MKKRFSLLLVILLLVFGIVGCKDNNPEHTHAYVEGECSCGEKDPNYVKPNPIIPDEVDTSSIIEKREGKTYYTSPDVPATNSTNDGLSKESPLFIEKAFARLTAGDTLIVLDGTYKLSSPIKLSEFQNGNFASYIKVIAEHPNKAILDFSMMLFNGSNRGIQIDGDYWYFYGIDITGAGDNGMYIGGNNNIIELCKFYCNRDSGLQLGRANGSYTNIKDWPSNNLIKNCTSFDNYDDETYGENADGFAAKLTTGEGNVFDGCIAYRNCDDGWDMYAKSDSGNVGLTVLINCVSFETNKFAKDAAVTCSPTEAYLLIT